jgi:hypothetical protein
MLSYICLDSRPASVVAMLSICAQNLPGLNINTVTTYMDRKLLQLFSASTNKCWEQSPSRSLHITIHDHLLISSMLDGSLVAMMWPNLRSQTEETASMCVVTHILNKQSQTAIKGWYSGLGIDKVTYYKIIQWVLDSDKFFWNKHRTGGIWIVRDLYESG